MGTLRLAIVRQTCFLSRLLCRAFQPPARGKDSVKRKNVLFVFGGVYHEEDGGKTAKGLGAKVAQDD